MKKILTLIGALSLIAAIATPVVACTSKTMNTAAQALIDKIKGAQIRITAPLRSKEETIKAREELVKNAPITQQEANELTFSGALEFDASSPVTVTAHVDGQTATGQIQVYLNKSDTPAQDLINKINNAAINVPSGTPVEVANQQTQTAIRSALEAAKQISTQEANELNFTGSDLVVGQAIEVTVTARVGTETATGKINVKLLSNQAQGLIDQIAGADISVPTGTPVEVANQQTQTAIRSALEAAKGISTQEANELSFTGPNLTAGQKINITATARVQQQTATGQIQVELSANPAQDLIDKVNNAQINVPQGTNPTISTPETQTAIRDALKAAKSLTPQEATELSFSGSNLVAGQAVQITVTALVAALTATGEINVTLSAPTPPPPPGPTSHILSGYWFGWTPAGGNPQTISEINSSYNVVNVSFWYASEANTIPTLDPNITKNKAQVIAGITKQHQEGHRVMLSIGGATDASDIPQSMQGEYKTALENVLKEYNFDGVDIDLEGVAAHNQNNLNILKNVLPQIYNAWKAQGKTFYITMAPEFPELRANASIYPDLIKDLAPYYSWIQPQIYNQAGDGVNATPADVKALGVPYYLSQSNEQYHSQFLYLVMKYLTTQVPNNFDVVIPANKLLLGLPATPAAANNGYTTLAGIKDAYQLFQQYKLNISGLMTWATPFDGIGNQWQYAQSYNETWGP